jgi:hypothetical protein
MAKPGRRRQRRARSHGRRADGPAVPLVPLRELRAIGDRVRADTIRILADVAKARAAAESLLLYGGRSGWDSAGGR